MTQRQTTTTREITALDGIEVSDEINAMLARMESRKADPRAMTDDEREAYVLTLCRALRLNPLTRPVQFIVLSNREVLYVTRTATDQLAAMHGLNRRTIDGPRIVDILGVKVATCTVEVSLPNGRSETATATLPAVDPVNLYMKLETKAKRRGTLSILGLGVLAEDEIETIPGAQRSDRPQPRAIERDPPRDHRELADLGIEQPRETPAKPVADDQGTETPPVAQVTSDAQLPPVVEAFARLVAEVELPGECVVLWVNRRTELAALAAADREVAWRALCDRCAEVGRMTPKAAKVWLKKAIGEETARRTEAQTIATREVQS